MSKKKPEHEWRMEPHVCRVCFGRVVSRETGDDAMRVYQCSNCGLEASGTRPAVLCACGTKLNRGGGKFVDAGLRCHENLAVSPAFPSLFVASPNGAQPES